MKGLDLYLIAIASFALCWGGCCGKTFEAYTKGEETDLTEQYGSCLTEADAAEFGWVGSEAERNADGPFVVESQDWGSSYISNAMYYYLVKDILRHTEAKMMLRKTLAWTLEGDNAVSRCGASNYHVNMEYWSLGRDPITTKYTTTLSSCTLATDPAYPGQTGVYLTNAALNNPKNIMEYFRFWKEYPTEFLSTFENDDGSEALGDCKQDFCDSRPLSATVPATVAAGMTSPGLYRTDKCKSSGGNCVRFYHIRDSWQNTLFESLFNTLDLPVVIQYPGFDEQKRLLREATTNNKATLFYSWVPSELVSNLGTTRVTFAPFSWTCFNQKEFAKVSTLNCDFSPSYIKALAPSWLPTFYPSEYKMIKSMKLLDGQMDAILKDVGSTQKAFSTAVCDWLKSHKEDWKGWIPLFPSKFNFEAQETAITSAYKGTVQLVVNETVKSASILASLGYTQAINGTHYIALASNLQASWSKSEGGPKEFPIEIIDLPENVGILLRIGAPSTGNVVPGSVSTMVIRGSSTQSSDSHLLIIVIGVVAGVFVLVLLSAFMHYYLKLQKEKTGLEWIIPFSDLNVFAHRPSMESGISNPNPEKQSKASPDVSLIETSSNAIASYKGNPVVVHQLPKSGPTNLNITPRMCEELNALRTVNQTCHINRLVGADLNNAGGVRCLIFEYCSKGSLEDLIDSGVIPESQQFRISFIRDILSGMKALQALHISLLGRLNPSRCLVDSRWQVKLEGFGLRSILEHFLVGDNQEEEFDKMGTFAERPMYDKKYWAPEINSKPGEIKSLAVEEQERANIYSVGIILAELFCGDMRDLFQTALEHAQETGYDENDPRKCKDSVASLMEKSGCQLRCDETLELCIWACTEWKPSLRHTPKGLKRILANKYPQTNDLITNMIKLIEGYSQHLEDIVTDRTVELENEKKKMERVLLQMMPRKIVDQLKLGKGVEPESFACSSVFFSDIVEFTSICSHIEALSVIKFLNSLYTMFDSVIDRFDVYKVETIGDAYMVVSGLPTRLPDHIHPSILCSMALALIESSKKFPLLDFISKTRLLEIFAVRKSSMNITSNTEDAYYTHPMIRVGIHTGQVVAGVAGVRMPRYCLFGDTVNFASRMESLGEPFKVHTSKATHDYIMAKYECFSFTERPEVQVKGKGACTTYWCDGASKVVYDCSGPQDL
eukprot:Nk52_evm24s2449 gene=Nk52_evmTU24s2449